MKMPDGDVVITGEAIHVFYPMSRAVPASEDLTPPQPGKRTVTPKKYIVIKGATYDEFYLFEDSDRKKAIFAVPLFWHQVCAFIHHAGVNDVEVNPYDPNRPD